MGTDSPPSAHEQITGDTVKDELSTRTDSPQLNGLNTATHPASKSPSQPIPSTETTETASDMTTGPKSKKKGTATAAKKVPKRPKPSSGINKPAKKPKSGSTPDNGGEDDAMEDDDSSAESDNGPYCLCRGPDDHRWMICCEKCEDWFHGQCINLDKTIGESLIERFICPNCTTDTFSTLYKKTCALGGCRNAARLASGEQSMFCSNDHTQMWWERMVSRLPKSKGKSGLNDQLTQGEFMALLNSGLASVGDDGLLKLSKLPFQDDLAELQNGDGNGKDEDLAEILSDEERSFLETAANARYNLAQEAVLCDHMLTLIELAQKRRRAAIDGGRFGEDICGYDYRLDTISARDAFAAFIKSPEGETVLETKQLGPPPRGEETEDGGDDSTRGMCERKRCKVHSGWQKLLAFGINYQVREMAGQAEEVSEEERVVREAARERSRRKKAEHNWAEVLDG